MKSILKLVTLSLIFTFVVISCNNDDENEDKTDVLTLNLSGLEELGADFVYEGWIIVDGNPKSTGTFSSVVFPQTFEIDADDLLAATKFVLSIEPANDTDPDPAATKILVGDFSGSSANVTTAVVGDFSSAAGEYILATPTDGAMTNETSGIWFLDLSSGMPETGLNLPVLPDGWKYEGWAVIDGTPVTTGTFTDSAAIDDSAPYSGGMSGPPFPGEDFLENAPLGLTFPTNIAGGKAVISIEPSPDNSPSPFTLKPLVGDIPAMALDHVTYSTSQNLSSFPSGSVSR